MPYVDVDHIGGVAAAVRHLLATGRRRIATIAGPQDMVAGIDRLAGYRAALHEAGLPEHVAVGDFTRESGVRAMRQLLDDDPQLDAVFVASDLMAHGALHALQEAGRRVPADVAVIGFDDFEISRLQRPAADHGPAADRRHGPHDGATDARPGHGNDDVPPAVVLPTELVVRASA